MGVARDFWDGAYRDGSFEGQWDYAVPSPELVGALAVMGLPTGSEVLDVGTGGGRDSIYLAQHGFVVSAIDASAAAIDVARQRASLAEVQVFWVVGDVLEMPFASGRFDLVVDRCCFHHVREEDRPRYGREVFRVMKPGARFLLRGARESRPESFFAVSGPAVRTHLRAAGFDAGPLLPIALPNNAGHLDANMIALRKPLGD